MKANKSPEKLGRDPDAPTNVAPKIIRTREELAALDLDTVLAERRDTWGDTLLAAFDWMNEWGDGDSHILAVIATGNQVRAARQALEEA